MRRQVVLLWNNTFEKTLNVLRVAFVMDITVHRQDLYQGLIDGDGVPAKHMQNDASRRVGVQSQLPQVPAKVPLGHRRHVIQRHVIRPRVDAPQRQGDDLRLLANMGMLFPDAVDDILRGADAQLIEVDEFFLEDFHRRGGLLIRGLSLEDRLYQCDDRVFSGGGFFGRDFPHPLEKLLDLFFIRGGVFH